MKITGVICEFNPFHRGHEYLLKKLRTAGAELVVCVMSGSFVQRGEAAIADKYSRAAMAVRCGADLVIELPFPFSSASAESFAAAGVRLLGALGVDTIGFGSECGDVDVLKGVSAVVVGEDFLSAYRRRCREGEGAAAAYYSAYREVAECEMPAGSNDILGVEYIKAAALSGVNVSFEAVGRIGSSHTSREIDGSVLPSATAIRESILSGGCVCAERFMPPEAFCELMRAAEDGCAPASMKNLERAVISYLRLSRPGDFAGIAECAGGVGERIRRAARGAADYEELLASASAKNYTDNRLRRAILFAMTGVTKADLRCPPVYTLLLAANRRGAAYLSEVRRKTTLPIITKPADVQSLLKNPGISRQRELSERADALWGMALDNPAPADMLIKKKPVIFGDGNE